VLALGALERPCWRGLAMMSCENSRPELPKKVFREQKAEI
jgi:hypothetical protein